MTPLKMLAFAIFLGIAVVLAAHGLHSSPFLIAAAETGDPAEPPAPHIFTLDAVGVVLISEGKAHILACRPVD